MGVSDMRVGDTARAFDSVAGEYDAMNRRNVVICEMRRHLRLAVTRAAVARGRLLDLGCGPGPDAVYFGQQGHRVVAIDVSSDMVREARQAVRHAGVEDLVTVAHWDMQHLDTLPDAGFDVIYSNLGPFNCVPDLSRIAAPLCARLRPGGTLVASVIGRHCPWEWVRFLAPGEWPRLTVRFARQLVPVPLNDRTVWTRYYTPGEFERPFVAEGLRRVSLRGLGITLPPPYLEGFADRHPVLVRALGRTDDHIGHWPLVRELGDHFLVVMRKGTT